MANRKPVLGYPSKEAAIVALKGQGLDWDQIVEKVGGTIATAKALWQSGKKRRPNGGGQADTRGLWTTDKIDRAKRLLGKTTIYIAEALQVPPEELLKLYISGELPPIGETQRKAQLLQLAQEGRPMPAPSPGRGPARPLAEPPAADPDASPAPSGEPSREDDEADLAALEEEGDDDEAPAAEPFGDGPGGDSTAGSPVREGPTVAPSVAAAIRVTGSGADNAAGAEDEEEASATTEPEAAAGKRPLRYRLTDGAGRYVLEDPARGMTLNRALAWAGTAAEMELLFKQRPALKELDPERVP